MKHLQSNQEFRFNEVLFEHRNKEYGAYVLRTESDRILTKSFFIGMGVLAVFISGFVISSFKSSEKVIKDDIFYRPIDIIPNDPPEEVLPPKPEIVKPTTAPNVKTVDERLPEPKAEVIHEKVVEKIEGAVAGTKNNSDGEIAPPNVYVPTAPTVGPATVTPPVQPPVVEKVADPNAIVTSVDVEASFPGGINAFRDKVTNNFDSSSFDGTGEMAKTIITFVVEKDGTISGIKANGADADFNNEAIRTIKTVRGKWVPAKLKGQAVRSYFKFPISMKFDN
ncbi:energy transducer TonB [Chryseobacterium oryctis]|uniref:Energy transducer TonB n=1 Tax=Chryseobacterium oryctis TaxID=2952618 RepID=A0ABT3HNN2_9FLAO|nr:energy transducer TonB [Chryseobacterium oryctis]MCW3161348.1 energy transducer TonB [Chryseobacterium oryctis]